MENSASVFKVTELYTEKKKWSEPFSSLRYVQKFSKQYAAFSFSIHMEDAIVTKQASKHESC